MKKLFSVVFLTSSLFMMSFKTPSTNCCPPRGTVLRTVDEIVNGCFYSYNIVANGRCGSKKY